MLNTKFDQPTEALMTYTACSHTEQVFTTGGRRSTVGPRDFGSRDLGITTTTTTTTTVYAMVMTTYVSARGMA